MTSLKSNDSQTPVETSKLFTAIIQEEKSGKPMPRIPIKLMGEHPYYIGQRLATLVQNRFSLKIGQKLDVMPNGQLVSIHLDSSYLMVKFAPPCPTLKVRHRNKAFSAFVNGVKLGLSSTHTSEYGLMKMRAGFRQFGSRPSGV